MKNKNFFGIEIASNGGENCIRFDSTDKYYRLIFRKRSWYVEVSARAHFKSASAEIELLEEESLLKFVNRFFETYPTFDFFCDTFHKVSDDEDGGGLISYASILD